MLALACPKCESTQLRLAGSKNGKKRCECVECGHHTTQPEPVRPPKDEVDSITEHQLTKTLRDHKSELKNAFDNIAELQRELEILKGLTNQSLKPPRWIQPKRRHKDDVAIATAMLSDCHFDERVNPAEIGWVNAYDREIARLRLQAFFQNTLKLSFDYFSGIEVEGLVLAMGGDMVTGNIHSELAASNDSAGIMETVLFWSEELAAGIELLLTRFDKLLIPCVTGNHGRNSTKPIHKGRNSDNFDWLIYQLLARHFKGRDGVDFIIPDGIAARYSVYNTRYHLEHGDNGFRGGNGVAGIWSPIMRGDLKLRERERAAGTPYDILMLGHFHQLKFATGQFVMNGSTKGACEYSDHGKFGLEPPQQAFWLTDPRHGMTMQAPIHCVSSKETWHKQRPIQQFG